MIASTAIIQSIEQLLDGEIGTTRTVGTAVAGMGHIPWHGQVLTQPRFDVQIVGTRKHGSTPISAISDRRIDILNVQIDVRHQLNASILEDERRAVRASVLLDIDRFKQALHYPGNLDTTSAGTSTNIISGLLMNLDSRQVSEEWEEEPQQLHTQITGEAWVTVTQPTS
jgi:hypothetical protein